MKMQYIIFHLSVMSEYITVGYVKYYLNNITITKNDNSLKQTLSGPKHERKFKYQPQSVSQSQLYLTCTINQSEC